MKCKLVKRTYKTFNKNLIQGVELTDAPESDTLIVTLQGLPVVSLPEGELAIPAVDSKWSIEDGQVELEDFEKFPEHLQGALTQGDWCGFKSIKLTEVLELKQQRELYLEGYKQSLTVSE